MNDYKPREGSVAEKAITELANGPRWAGDLANELGIDTSPLGASLKVALDVGAVNQLATDSGRLRVFYLPGDHAAALEMFRQRARPAEPAAAPTPAAPPKRTAKVQRQAAKPKAKKAPKVAPTKRKKRTTTSLPAAIPVIEAAAPVNGEQLAVTEAGEIVVLREDRVTHRLPSELVQRIAVVANRLQARRA